jgi:hypothetical protein
MAKCAECGCRDARRPIQWDTEVEMYCNQCVEVVA